jgi:hypothetical protein
MWQDLEAGFNRALNFSFSKKKWLFVFPILLLCGLLIVLSHILSVGVHHWVSVSLAFFPLFFCATILMAAGIPLIRIYHDEVKGKSLSYRRTLKHSWKLMGETVSLMVPLLLGYLVLWALLGIFYLFKAIPHVGEILGIILSFGPFLLILGSLILSVFALLLLFFFTPQVALKSVMSWELVEKMFVRFKSHFFGELIFLILGLVPVLVVVGLLVLAATLTGMTYFVTEGTGAIGLQWFFIMIPFAALLSPAAVFFFNFAAESFVALQRRPK